MQYGSIEHGKCKIGTSSVASHAINIPNIGSYSDIFDGALQIKIDLDPLKESNKRYAKSRGMSDGPYTPFRP